MVSSTASTTRSSPQTPRTTSAQPADPVTMSPSSPPTPNSSSISSSLPATSEVDLASPSSPPPPDTSDDAASDVSTTKSNTQILSAANVELSDADSMSASPPLVFTADEEARNLSTIGSNLGTASAVDVEPSPSDAGSLSPFPPSPEWYLWTPSPPLSPAIDDDETRNVSATGSSSRTPSAANMEPPATESTTTPPPPIPATNDGQVNTKTGLMDLPVEVRTEIYGYLLHEEKPIQLEMRRLPRLADRSTGGTEVCRYREYPDMKVRRRFDENFNRWVFKEIKFSSILFVNQQIHLEAESVLYGNNVLSFDSTTCLGKFLKKVGVRRAQYLRNIQIRGNYVKTTAKETFELLCAAKGLRTLEMRHYNFCQDIFRSWQRANLSQVAEHMAPLFNKLLDSYEAEGLKGSVWDILRLAPGGNTNCKGVYVSSVGCKCAHFGAHSHTVDEESKRLVDEIHAGIKKRLQVTE